MIINLSKSLKEAYFLAKWIRKVWWAKNQILYLETITNTFTNIPTLLHAHVCDFSRFRLRCRTRTHLSHTINPSHTHPHLPPFLAHIVCVMLCYSETVGVGQRSHGATRRGYGRYPSPTTHTPLSHHITSLSLLYSFVMKRLLGTPHWMIGSFCVKLF